MAQVCDKCGERTDLIFSRIIPLDDSFSADVRFVDSKFPHIIKDICGKCGDELTKQLVHQKYLSEQKKLRR